MRIVIIGAGNAGRHLARTLCELAQDVVLIDRDHPPLSEIEGQLDILTIHGPGASPSVLDRAGIDRADLVVAVTSADEVNILACAYAKAHGVKHKVARVTNPDYAQATCKLDLQAMGVDLTVSHKEECAREIFNILHMPGTVEVVDLLEGKAQTVGIKVSTTSPLMRNPLKDFPRDELISRIRFIAGVRGTELFIPTGDTQFMLGDDVYVTLLPKDIPTFVDWACPDHPVFDKVIVGGGGDLGYSLARRLEDISVQVVLLEQDRERAEYCSGHLDRALVLRGDILDRDILAEAGIVDNTAFVAVTGDDENNIISCLMAEKEGAAFTLAQVTKPEYVPIINGLSLLDRAVSPHLSMTNAILHFVRGQHVTRSHFLHNLPGELIEIALSDTSKSAGTAIKDLAMPKGAIIAAVLRNDEVCPATGNLALEGGDRLVVFAQPEFVAKVEARFSK